MGDFFLVQSAGRGILFYFIIFFIWEARKVDYEMAHL